MLLSPFLWFFQNPIIIILLLSIEAGYLCSFLMRNGLEEDDLEEALNILNVDELREALLVINKVCVLLSLSSSLTVRDIRNNDVNQFLC